MKNKKLFVLFLTLLFVTKASAVSIQDDPIGDVHHSIVGPCFDLQTDIREGRFEEVREDFVVTMTMSQPIRQGPGYREYYFWMDVDPSAKIGYQPYAPHSVAWPDVYADYRIFMSINSENMQAGPVNKVALQDCAKTDCSKDDGLKVQNKIKTKVDGSKLIFTWPKDLLPKLRATSQIKLGYTTYYEFFQCNGEDDLPQWGKHGIVIENPATPPPTRVPEPK